MSYALFSTSTTSSTPVSGLGTGDTINKVILVWILQGTDDAGASDLTVQANLAAAAANAIAAGRSTTLTAGVNDAAIAAFQTTAGTQISVGSPTNGQVFIPACQWTENKNGGGTQAGNWTKGAATTFNTATTTTTTAAPTTTTTAAPTTTTTAAPTTTTTAAPVLDLSTSNFNYTTAGAGAITFNSPSAGKVLLTNGSIVSDAAILVKKTSIPRAATKTYRVGFKVNALSTGNAVTVFSLQENTVSPVPSDNASINANLRINIAAQDIGGVKSIRASYIDGAGAFNIAMAPGSGWSTTGSGWDTAFTIGTDYFVELVSTSTTFKIRLLDSGLTLIKETDLANWSNVKNGSNPLWAVMGESYTNYYAGDSVTFNSYSEL